MRFGRQILALRVIHFLLSHQPGFRLENTFEPLELQMRDLVLRLNSGDIVLGTAPGLGITLDEEKLAATRVDATTIRSNN